MGRVAVFALLLIASLAITEAAMGRNLQQGKKEDNPPQGNNRPPSCDGSSCPRYPCIEFKPQPPTSPRCDPITSGTYTYNIINKCKDGPDTISYVACYDDKGTCTKVENVHTFPYSSTNPYSTITLDCSKTYKCILHDGSFKNGRPFSYFPGAPDCAKSQDNKCPYCQYEIKPACPAPTPCPPSTNKCKENKCVNGMCVLTNLPDGTRCGEGETSPCDGANAMKLCCTKKCVMGMCQEVPRQKNFPCRPKDMNNACDVEEKCDGRTLDCPPNMCAAVANTIYPVCPK